MQAISSNELREMYQRFFELKDHVRIPSAPLVPENDPSVLFTTAGMHPLVPYLKGEAHPQGRRLVNVQKCLRTTDIDDVGDAVHATVFEMLGNWSLGDYFKKEAIAYSWEFLTGKKWLGISPSYLAVSVFAGDDRAPRDEESAIIWQEVGVPSERITYLDNVENWWPAGGGAAGPQGPDTEMFYWVGEDKPPRDFDPTDKRWVEIWNDVFMQYNQTQQGGLEKLAQQNVDTGMGLERVVMVLSGLASIYEIDTYQELMSLITKMAEPASAKATAGKHERIVADHIKAATFLLGDEHPVAPSNTDQGYVLRRVIRRAMRSAKVLGYNEPTRLFTDGAELLISKYEQVYPSLRSNKAAIVETMREEIERFASVLQKGLREFETMVSGKHKGGVISGADAFRLYESFGFPIENTQEMAKERGLVVEMGDFAGAFKKHQEVSREGAKGKFAGGLADHSDQSICYHTATHLLHQALREVLGDHVQQKGSNITPKRLRFDFSHPDKLTPEQIQQTEDLVNEKIKIDLVVAREEMTVAEAKEKGALGLFEKKYRDHVSVYFMGDYSVEICGGPHVKRTGELGIFKITSEGSVGAGARRIKATLQ